MEKTIGTGIFGQVLKSFALGSDGRQFESQAVKRRKFPPICLRNYLISAISASWEFQTFEALEAQLASFQHYIISNHHFWMIYNIY